MTFIVLEGFSGTGKTTLARRLETEGWRRLTESAHAVPDSVPLAERADLHADFSLLGATMMNCSTIASRGEEDVVSEGYLLSDLAYAKIRYELGKSAAYPIMVSLCKGILASPLLRPDLYLILEAAHPTIERRQMDKNGRERNESIHFRERYYTALAEIHEELGERAVARILTDSGPDATLALIKQELRAKGLMK